MTFFRPTRLLIDPFGTPDRGYATMRVTSPYGPRKGQFAAFHPALDIGNARLGDDVIAIGPGKVILATNQPAPPWNYAAPADKIAVWGPSYGGNVVVIEHEPGVWSQYVHLRDFAVSLGQRVMTGQLIGHIGDTGSAAPPPAGGGGHLHFGIRLLSSINNDHNGWVDPWPRIQPTGDLGSLPDTSTEDEPVWINDLKPGAILGVPTPCIAELKTGSPVSDDPADVGSAPYPDRGFAVRAIGVLGDRGAYLLNTGGVRFFRLADVTAARTLGADVVALEEQLSALDTALGRIRRIAKRALEDQEA